MISQCIKPLLQIWPVEGRTLCGGAAINGLMKYTVGREMDHHHLLLLLLYLHRNNLPSLLYDGSNDPCDPQTEAGQEECTDCTNITFGHFICSSCGYRGNDHSHVADMAEKYLMFVDSNTIAERTVN